LIVEPDEREGRRLSVALTTPRCSRTVTRSAVLTVLTMLTSRVRHRAARCDRAVVSLAMLSLLAYPRVVFVDA
jgi:hypothetical protein